MKYEAIYRHRETYSITAMCRFLEISRSGYYAHLKRRGRTDRDEALALLIAERRVQRYGKTLGCRRMQKWLAVEKGLHYNVKTVWRVMRKYGMLSVCRRKRFYRPGDKLNIYPNHLNRQFQADRPNQKWVTDITAIKTPQGMLYLSVILDLFDRSVVAYQTSLRNDTKLVLDTLNKGTEKKRAAMELHLHSDQGFQYTSPAYMKLTQQYGITPSMSRRANPYDNAVIENFFGMLKTESIYIDKPKTLHQAKHSIRDYMAFYNGERIILKS